MVHLLASEVFVKYETKQEADYAFNKLQTLKREGRIIDKTVQISKLLQMASIKETNNDSSGENNSNSEPNADEAVLDRAG